MADKKDVKKDDVFNLDGIRLLVELMKENSVSELDLEQGENRLKLRRNALSKTVGAVEMNASTIAPSFPVATSAPTPNVVPVPAVKPTVDDSAFVKTIDSPMVGTFYASSSPDAAPFVQVGDVVGPEKTVCIVEAMKVFNDIQAETNGKIVAVLVKSGDPVEYGTPLFKIDVRG